MIVPAFATTVFGGIWFLLASNAIKGPQVVNLILLILIGVITIILLLRSIRFARNARRFATGALPFADRRRLALYIGAIAFEIIVYLVGYNILAAFHRLDLVIPLLALAVGLHFLGLIPVFQTNRYISIAVVFCLSAIIGVFLPGLTHMNGFSLDVRTLLVSLVCGLYLWYVAIRLLTQGNIFIQEGQRTGVQFQ